MGKREGSSAQDIVTEQQAKEILEKHCLNPLERFTFAMLVYAGLRRDELAHLKPDWVFQKPIQNELVWVIQIPARQECACADCKRSKCGCMKKHLIELDREGKPVFDGNGKFIACAPCKKRLYPFRESIYDGFWTPKTRASAGFVFIVPPLLPLVLAWKGEPFKIGSADAIRKRINLIAQRFEPMGAKARFYPHSLRASFGSILFAHKRSWNYIKEQMRWKDYVTMVNYIKSLGIEVYTEFKQAEKEWV